MFACAELAPTYVPYLLICRLLRSAVELDLLACKNYCKRVIASPKMCTTLYMRGNNDFQNGATKILAMMTSGELGHLASALWGQTVKYTLGHQLPNQCNQDHFDDNLRRIGSTSALWGQNAHYTNTWGYCTPKWRNQDYSDD